MTSTSPTRPPLTVAAGQQQFGPPSLIQASTTAVPSMAPCLSSSAATADDERHLVPSQVTTASTDRRDSSMMEEMQPPLRGGDRSAWRFDVASRLQPTDLFAKGATRSDAVERYYARQAEAIATYLDVDHEQTQRRTEHGPVGATPPVGSIDGVRGGGDAATGAAAAAPSPTAADRARSDVADRDRRVLLTELATRLSLVLNVVLLIVKTVASLRSGSLTILASLVDSALDLFSGSVLVLCQYLERHLNSRDFPLGKGKFEPLGTLVFSCAMFVAAAKLIETSINTMIAPAADYLTLDAVTVALIVVVIVTKFTAAVLCFRFAGTSSAVLALAWDHRNDVVCNVVGLVGVELAKYVWIYIDPITTLAITLLIMYVWARSAYYQIVALSGRTAPPEVLNALTLLARNHDPRVIAIDTVRAVTAGTGFVVEIDLVLPGTLPLKDAHDIGESLQLFLERVKGLEISRAYVHLDYETTHNPAEHQ